MTMKPAPAKKPGAAGGIPGKAQKKEKKPKKPMARPVVALLTVFIMLLLVGGAGACLWFDVGGFGKQAAALFPQYRAAMADVEKLKEDQVTAGQKLAADREALAAKEKALAKAEANLASREEKLKTDQAALEARQGQVKTEEERRQTIIDIYSAMDAKAAAEMLDKATTLQDAAAILKLLPTETVASILAEMDAKKAYELTKLLGQ